MKLYLWSKANNQKVFLSISAKVRDDLRRALGGDWFNINDGYSYSVNEVFAERDVSNTTVGAVMGGIVGALGGPIGIAIGAGLGGIIGNSSDEEEQRKVNTFNSSW